MSDLRFPTAVETRAIPSLQLQYAFVQGEDGLWDRLPDWARFMVGLGDALAQEPSGCGYTTVGLTVPTRAFAAALAVAGFVLRRNVDDPMDPGDVEEHFALLAAQPSGTAITLQQGARIHDGRLLGIVERDGAELIQVETRKMVRYLPKTLALQVRLTGEDQAPEHLRARRVQVPPLLRALTGIDAATTYMTTARADGLIAGTLAALEEELTEEPLAPTLAGFSPPTGTLQEIVRARDLAGASRHFRTVIVPASSPVHEADKALTPKLVIFDGGRPYLRLRHLWPSAHRLVVIDRSLGTAEEAADELSMAFIDRRSDSDILEGLGAPSSIEAFAFRGAS
jgi:hypothetical protein